MESNGKKATSVILPTQLVERMEDYLKSPVSIARSKRELFEKSVIDFLDREEIVAAKLEKELLRIRGGLR